MNYKTHTLHPMRSCGEQPLLYSMDVGYNMSKKVTVSTGITVWIITPLLLSNIYDINFLEMLKSFFSFIHLLALSSVLLIDYQSRHKIQKTLVLIVFIVYPLLLTADSTQIFDEKTFLVVFITAWIYLMGFAGWLYS
ncbi:hypothetical protein C8N40_10188 [Pontibacter mucosus]|uniref:Uncharacterized protein n=1 Tax=Pontibacter mucosus TaxID=1649266 RepID=A0A2T5YSK2_9BACT|nr:hypothetical protein [Pontibacter mucosus]PTX22266.1 hypothetical protein C8N40_10188 [Pontibacter mucosus]